MYTQSTVTHVADSTGTLVARKRMVRKLYTLAELKAEQPDAYERAHQAFTESEMESWQDFRVDDLTQEMVDFWAKEKYGYIVDNLPGKKHSFDIEWDADRASFVAINGSLADVNAKIRQFHKAGKLTGAEAIMLLRMVDTQGLDILFQSHSRGYIGTTTNVVIDPGHFETDLQDERAEKLAALVLEEYKDFEGDCIEMVHKEEEYTWSEEYFDDLCSDDLFTASGEMVHVTIN